ncbi:hypothetical protein EHI8A_012110 [Entamoeba histolytica HM-1:IMSS-B]|uniref:Uncharacterized protein n=6 Tax=Entamoeba histolytica TaxID=5759 RepID=C4M6F7_ENTH1|nr:hypothetical protein EHI_099770 [Entamoeba histolytica HM-1:IMSS]EMD49514.1 Hypothetical protein EHI5A_026860 [Entamoeba histolytica KU27]EMH75163.1 hypothetical protein EHI8A_012110 [Entamoeba histolytica HM-1:IMSS-B]EMS13733.1 hypothetical protein KM1_028360 [Entamoeba histolytica HM-3:IMSS]ENY63012.1 hypothetical protein EHI7A_012170 [Entamoeba histolytica HM-1:IMSS-A]GAT97075.1 hypothetical protein CL6EHI_099770 [Entamoeba histolytica]|eukprot:XP_651273.1 hypothetical protein EHI_099770 [Entamoeba histolytica HM-1:IMSS]
MSQNDIHLLQNNIPIHRNKVMLFSMYVSCGISIVLIIIMIIVCIIPVHLPSNHSMDKSIQSFKVLNMTLMNLLNETQLLNGSVNRLSCRGGVLSQSLNSTVTSLLDIYKKDELLLSSSTEMIAGIIKLLEFLKIQKFDIIIKQPFIDQLKKLNQYLIYLQTPLNQLIYKINDVVYDFIAYTYQIDFLSFHFNHSLLGSDLAKSLLNRSFNLSDVLLEHSQSIQKCYYFYVIIIEILCFIILIITFLLTFFLYRRSFKVTEVSEIDPLLSH